MDLLLEQERNMFHHLDFLGLRSPESFQKFILKMSSIIQQETKILELAEIMARGCSFESEIATDLEKEEVA